MGHWVTGVHGPNPLTARTVDEFGACLRRLKLWAGDPSFAELRRRTGIPSSTLADAFSARRTGLPRLEVVRLVVRACGGGPDEVTRWELGWRRVRERQRAVATAESPPVPGPHQLPRDLTHLVGRAGHLDRLHELVGDRRSPLALLVGPPGVGKTALAVRWGHQVAGMYADGQLYVDLSGTATSEALGTLLTSLGVPGGELPAAVEERAALFRTVTYSRRLLVVLDDAQCSEQVRPLLPGGPWCCTLVTSRDRLSELVSRHDAHRLALRPLLPRESERLIGLMLPDGRTALERDATRELACLCGHLPMALRFAAVHLADHPELSISAYTAQLETSARLARPRLPGDEPAVTLTKRAR